MVLDPTDPVANTQKHSLKQNTCIVSPFVVIPYRAKYNGRTGVAYPNPRAIPISPFIPMYFSLRGASIKMIMFLPTVFSRICVFSNNHIRQDARELCVHLKVAPSIPRCGFSG